MLSIGPTISAAFPPWALALYLLVANQAAGAHGNGPSSREFKALTPDRLRSMATEWRITTQDYRRYLQLMQGVRGAWTPNADPLLALGAHAESSEELQRFAELYVRREAERVEGELAFQRAVNAAWRQLYPTQPRFVSTTGRVAASKILGSGAPARFAVVVEPNCDDCTATVERYVKRLNRLRTVGGLDLYVRGLRDDDAELRAWVAQTQIPIDLIRNERITINHGDQYLGSVPQVWMLRGDGDWVFTP
jgi:integrating conjugative element protein (TIGR03759 family)